MIYIQTVLCELGEHHFCDSDDQPYQVLAFERKEAGGPSSIPKDALVLFQVQTAQALTQESSLFARFIKEWAAYNNLEANPQNFADHLLTMYEGAGELPKLMVLHRDCYEVTKQHLLKLTFEGLLTKPQNVTML